MTQCENCLHKKICDLWRENEGTSAGGYSIGDTCDYFDGWIPAEGYTPEKGKYYIVRYVYPDCQSPFYRLVKWRGVVPRVIKITNFIPFDTRDPEEGKS